MAASYRHGREHRVQFSWNGKRHTIRCQTAELAKDTKYYVERLRKTKRDRVSIDAATKEWLKSCPENVSRVLQSSGLVEKYAEKTILALLQRTESLADINDSTELIWKNVARNLVEFFGADRPLESITRSDAAEFRKWLLKNGAVRDNKDLAQATISKRCQLARQWFGVAVDSKWIETNPFSGMKGWVDNNPDRQVFVPQETIRKIMDHVPSEEFQLIIALARWGGLRIPSEIRVIYWDEVDWNKRLMKIYAPKTRRHPGHASRFVPIFPEIMPLLQKRRDANRDGALVITDDRSAQALRTQFERYMRRARVQPWPKPWQNLRASRETELVNDFPVHVACSWIGNSPRVASKHYLQVTDDHIRRAVS